MMASMDGFLGLTYAAGAVVALWAAGLELGMRHSVSQIAAPLRRPGMLARVALVDVVVLPLIVWSLVRVLAVPSGYAIGLLLVGIASAGPLGIKAAQLARADAVTAVSLVVVLEFANLAAIPIWAALLLPADAMFSLARVLGTLAALILLPLAVGLASKRQLPRLTERALSLLPTVANIALVTAIAAILVRDADAVVAAAGERVPLVAAVTVVVALLLGWLAGGPAAKTRAAAALVTGIRANALALAIAAASFPDRPEVRAGVAVFAIFSAILPLGTALWLGRRPDAHAATVIR